MTASGRLQATPSMPSLASLDRRRRSLGLEGPFVPRPGPLEGNIRRFNKSPLILVAPVDVKLTSLGLRNGSERGKAKGGSRHQPRQRAAT